MICFLQHACVLWSKKRRSKFPSIDSLLVDMETSLITEHSILLFSADRNSGTTTGANFLSMSLVDAMLSSTEHKTAELYIWLMKWFCLQGDHASMNQQVANFGDTVTQMRRNFRGDTNALNSYISRCLFYSGMGSNDYLNNYFMPNFYNTSSDYTAKAYAAVLLKDYSRQLTVSRRVLASDMCSSEF